MAKKMGVCILLINLIIFVSAQSDKAFSFINMRKAVNMGFADKTAGDQKGGWFDQGPNNDLGTFPCGIQKFAGIQYDIINPEKNSGRSCIVLRGSNKKFFPLDSGPINVNSKARLIYFLTACGWNTSINKEVAFITVRYKQPGLYLDIPVRFKKECSGWWHPAPVPNGEIAWKGNNSSSDIGVFSFGWINPYPDQEIDSITLVSTNSGVVPVFIAATMVNDSTLAARLKLALEAKINKSKLLKKAPESAVLLVDFDAVGVPVSDDADSLALGFGQSKDYLAAARALVDAGKGKPFFRVQTSMGEPAPAEGVWDFKKLDSYVDNIYAAGGEPMLCFASTSPIWMAKPLGQGRSLRRNWRPRDLEEYASYCEAVVRHYNIERKTPVIWWEIGNETELRGWNYKYYVEVYKYIAPRLKKIDPNIKLGGPVNCSPNLGWASELLREAGDLVDFLSYHKYGYSEPFDSPDDYVMGKTTGYKDAVVDYIKETATLTKGRSLPVIVTEANTNPRFKKPEGTDPRIRTMFNAAWYMSALCHFVMGGGRSMCYFTLDGGFGACWYEKGKFTIFPVYHSLWLFRKLGQGNISPVKSSTPMVEAYAFSGKDGKRLIVINKMSTPVKVDLEFSNGMIPGNGKLFRLNSASAKACSALDANGNIPVLQASRLNWEKDKVTLNLHGFEVLGWESISDKESDAQ